MRDMNHDDDIGIELQSEDSGPGDELEWEVGGHGTGDGMDEEGDELRNSESEKRMMLLLQTKEKNSTKTYGLRRGMVHCSPITGMPAFGFHTFRRMQYLILSELTGYDITIRRECGEA
jgi:hypothetical protein